MYIFSLKGINVVFLDVCFCFLVKEKARKFVDPIDGEVCRWEVQDLRGLGGLDTVIRIYCMKNYLFSIKKIGIKFLK